MIIKFSESLMKEYDQEVFNTVEEGFLHKAYAYVINSKYRKSVWLTEWLEIQVQEASDEIKQFAEQIGKGSSVDATAVRVLRAVHDYVDYVGDGASKWDMREYWQTAEETLELAEGDCEDGTILQYVLCRLLDVPKDRLKIKAGDVVGGGHAWLAYRPRHYPLNWVYLDWTYWYDPSYVEQRSKFFVDGQDIQEYSGRHEPVESNYQSIWFAFNEDKSNTRLRYVFK